MFSAHWNLIYLKFHVRNLVWLVGEKLRCTRQQSVSSSSHVSEVILSFSPKRNIQTCRHINYLMEANRTANHVSLGKLLFWMNVIKQCSFKFTWFWSRLFFNNRWLNWKHICKQKHIYVGTHMHICTHTHIHTCFWVNSFISIDSWH